MDFTPAPVLPGYGLAPPAQDDALLHLARVMGVDRGVALWRDVCRRARVPFDADRPLSPAEMERAGEELSRVAGPAGVVGRGLVVRARTYLLLLQRQTETQH